MTFTIEDVRILDDVLKNSTDLSPFLRAELRDIRNRLLAHVNSPAYNHADRKTKAYTRLLGFCVCEHCKKLPTNG